ncbi:MAG TPA: FAD-binding protein [Ilumatobacteraceae bacterium]
MIERNWAGNYQFRAERLHRPTTLEQVREIVAATPQLRVLGSRHSFSAIADSAELMSLDGLPPDIAVDHGAGTVGCGPGVRYGELAQVLAPQGLALHNLASLPHISVAGAVATATHGSGDSNGNLATAVAGLEMVTSDGELLTVERGDEDFDGFVVGLGALGAVTRVILDVEPAYEIRQRVFEGLEWDALFANFDAITSSGYSVSIFTRWGEAADQVWVKSRGSDELEAERKELFGARAALVDRHPILGIDAVNCTPQLGVPGSWSDRLPHFRMGFTPSNGAELQSEFFVPRQHAVAALGAVRELADNFRPLLQVSEIRTIAADRLWMSPQYERESVGIHFTWVPDQAAVEAALSPLEAALAPFGARPHWGKVFLADAAAIAPSYPRHRDFVRLVEQLDARGTFRNDWLEHHVLGVG